MEEPTNPFPIQFCIDSQSLPIYELLLQIINKHLSSEGDGGGVRVVDLRPELVPSVFTFLVLSLSVGHMWVWEFYCVVPGNVT